MCRLESLKAIRNGLSRKINELKETETLLRSQCGGEKVAGREGGRKRRGRGRGEEEEEKEKEKEEEKERTGEEEKIKQFSKP